MHSLALCAITDILQSVVDKLKDGTLRYVCIPQPSTISYTSFVILSLPPCCRPFVFKTVTLQQVIEELTRLGTYSIGKLVMTVDTS